MAGPESLYLVSSETSKFAFTLQDDDMQGTSLADWKAHGRALATDCEVLCFALLIANNLVHAEEISSFCSDIEACGDSHIEVFKAPPQLTRKSTLVGTCLVDCFEQKMPVLQAVSSAMASFDGPGQTSGALPVSTLKAYVHDHKAGKVLGPKYGSDRGHSQKRVMSALPRISELLRKYGLELLETDTGLCLDKIYSFTHVLIINNEYITSE